MEIKKTTFLVIVFSLVWVPALTGASSLVAHYPDTILYNGKVVTVDKNFSVAQAVAIRDGKFLAVGKNANILALADQRTSKIDLKEKTEGK